MLVIWKKSTFTMVVRNTQKLILALEEGTPACQTQVAKQKSPYRVHLVRNIMCTAEMEEDSDGSYSEYCVIQP